MSLVRPAGFVPHQPQAYNWKPLVRLVELLGLVVVVALGVAFLGELLFRAPRQARGQSVAAATQMASFERALRAYKADTGAYPEGPEGLQALVVQPAEVQNWKGPYLTAVPLDPWQHAYQYEFPSARNAEAWEVTSAGKDGEFGTADDVVGTSAAK